MYIFNFSILKINGRAPFCKLIYRMTLVPSCQRLGELSLAIFLWSGVMSTQWKLECIQAHHMIQ